MLHSRQGSAKVKIRSEVRGGGRKPWRQKGTGRAGQGSTGSPQWRGGGTVFGPTPRSYGYKLPKKVRRLAIKSALSSHNGFLRFAVHDDIGHDLYQCRFFFELADKYCSMVGQLVAKEFIHFLADHLTHKEFGGQITDIVVGIKRLALGKQATV